jgi:hypothetical protein
MPNETAGYARTELFSGTSIPRRSTASIWACPVPDQQVTR